MIVQELVATLGFEAKHGQFANVFALLDHVKDYFEKVLAVIEGGFDKAFEAINQTAESANMFSREAAKFGVGTQALQELAYAANMGDVSVESLLHGLKLMSKAAHEAGQGNAEALSALSGVRLRDAAGAIRPVEELISDLSAQFQKMPAGAERTARALTLFGRSGTDMIPFLSMGPEEIARYRVEAEKLGYVINDKVIAASEKWETEGKRLQGALTGVRNAFAADLIEKVSGLFEKLRATIATKGFARAVQFLSRAFGALLDGLGFVVDAFEWFLSNDTRVEVALFAVSSALAGVTLAAMSAGSASIAAGAATIAAWAGAAAPFLLLGGLIALIFDDVYTYLIGGKSLLGKFIAEIDKVNPNDNALVQLFKSLASLVFDVTDPAKWKRFRDTLVSTFVELAAKLKAAFPPLVWQIATAGAEFAGHQAAGGAALAERIFAKSEEAQTVGTRNNVERASTGAVTFNNPVTVNVPPGSDAHEIANLVSRRVREENLTMLREAGAATSGAYVK
jgi:hypothetical protein